jgi:hypothetical protein
MDIAGPISMPVRSACRHRHFGRTASAVLLLLALPLAAAGSAQACACCSERGSRVDSSVELDAPTRTQLERMTFGEQATLTTGIADEPSGLPSGIGSSFALTATRAGDIITFAFRGPTGVAGALRFTVPNHIWIFVIDPFGDAKDEGLGPPLYKEWRLTADIHGDGIFTGATPPGKMATLIFHGRGRGCTEAEDFTDWSLQLQAPVGHGVTLYGRLEQP